MPRAPRNRLALLCVAMIFLVGQTAWGGGGSRPDSPQEPVSFLNDVAPVLARHCVACHNPKKSESKYDVTTFVRLAKGGEQGKDVTLEPGQPDESRLVELLRHDGQPRMPLNQDPLPNDVIALIERWVREGARYDGDDPNADWAPLLRKRTLVIIPERYPVALPISALAFSPDGTTLATAGDHEVNLWRLLHATLTRRLRGLAERVYDIVYSPDGKWLATASGDPGRYGSVQLWVAEPGGGGKPVRDLLESNDAVFTVAFSADSKHLAAAGSDRAVRVWEVETGKLLRTIEDHSDWILGLAFSPDGEHLATASRDKTSKVFDLQKRESEALATFTGHGETVYAVAFTPDGKKVVTGGGDNLVRVWNPWDEAKQTDVLRGFGGAVFRLLYTPDGQQLIACSADHTVRVFNQGIPRLTLQGHGDWVYALALSPRDQMIASGSWDGEVRLWSLAKGKSIKTFPAAPGFHGLAGLGPAER